jgi:hypothetical protein
LLAVTCAWTIACSGAAIMRSMGSALMTEPIRLLLIDMMVISFGKVAEAAAQGGRA